MSVSSLCRAPCREHRPLWCRVRPGNRRTPIKRRESLQRLRERGPEIGVAVHLTVHREGNDFKTSRGPVGLRVHASDKALTPENRQAEVAILSFGGGYITFDLVVKAEQLLQTFALNDQVVKRRQEAYRRGYPLQVWRRAQCL